MCLQQFKDLSLRCICFIFNFQTPSFRKAKTSCFSRPFWPRHLQGHNFSYAWSAWLAKRSLRVSCLKYAFRSSIEVTSSCVYVFSLTSTRFIVFVERFELRKDIPESRFKFQDPLVPWYCIVQLILRGHLGPCLAQGKLSATLAVLQRTGADCLLHSSP